MIRIIETFVDTIVPALLAMLAAAALLTAIIMAL
jgi:hypothetical protein